MAKDISFDDKKDDEKAKRVSEILEEELKKTDDTELAFDKAEERMKKELGVN